MRGEGGRGNECSGAGRGEGRDAGLLSACRRAGVSRGRSEGRTVSPPPGSGPIRAAAFPPFPSLPALSSRRDYSWRVKKTC